MEPRDPAKPTARRTNRHEVGPFVLRSLLEDLPLSADRERNDIEINCVEFLGMCSGVLMFSVSRNGTDNIQTGTSMLVHLLPKSSIFFRFPQTLTIHLHYLQPFTSLQVRRGQESSRYYSFRMSTRPVYYATGLSHSTLCQNSVLSGAQRKFGHAIGLVA
jgi:hypothetical protein